MVSVPDDDVLVHPALFDAALAVPPDAEQDQRKTSAMAHPASHEDVLALEVDAGDAAIERREAIADLVGKVRFDHFIGVETHHPVRVDFAVVQRPLELLRMIDERAFEHGRARGARDLDGAVRRMQKLTTMTRSAMAATEASARPRCRSSLKVRIMTVRSFMAATRCASGLRRRRMTRAGLPMATVHGSSRPNSTARAPSTAPSPVPIPDR